ncbi:MAG: helix-turn-helix transcriptional regulator [Bacteroides sp.]|nr:helix-turn-helix transcriptional regulator [Bacillota bacterium]MCM1393317.1 helix-turn-helix transcriptional regulator [[Eubacterium] siraeum]MCM1455645.1 helix-turn-helix transcriptional regulator [Bacteroides sp.]
MMHLKDLRIKHGLTQKQVAKIAGLSLKTYAKYESGNYGGMKISKIFALMQYYGVSCDELMGEI